MVKSPRTATNPSALRALNAPEAISVQTIHQNWPSALVIGRAQSKVNEVLDAWRIEDEWWRDSPLIRTYFDVLVSDGRRIIIYHDHVSKHWFKQNYA